MLSTLGVVGRDEFNAFVELVVIVGTSLLIIRIGRPPQHPLEVIGCEPQQEVIFILSGWASVDYILVGITLPGHQWIILQKKFLRPPAHGSHRSSLPRPANPGATFRFTESTLGLSQRPWTMYESPDPMEAGGPFRPATCPSA